MTRIRTQQVPEKALAVVREARPALAELSGRRKDTRDDQGAPTTIGPAHAVHVIGLRDLVEGARVSETPAALRVLERRGAGITAFYDVTPSESDPELMQMVAAVDHPYGPALERALALADSWAEYRQGEADLRLLRIPALNTEALLLRVDGEDEETAIVVRTLQADLKALNPMPLSELMSRLEAPARLILETDDGRKGS